MAITRRTLAASAGMAALAQGCERLGLPTTTKAPDKQIPQAAPDPVAEGPEAPSSPPAPPPGQAPTPPPVNETPADGGAVTLDFSGTPTQGAALIGRTAPGAQIIVDGEVSLKADAQGLFLIGFDRDAKAKSLVVAALGDGRTVDKQLAIAPRAYLSQVIQQQTSAAVGGAQAQIDEWFDLLPTLEEERAMSARAVSDETEAKKARDVQVKKQAMQSQADIAGFAEPWVAPYKGRITSKWGTMRTLNTPRGPNKRPHYGVDIARPAGVTGNPPIVAPTRALVVLAEPDMVLEGGCVFLDHGQGLISIYLHMNSVLVKKGDIVTGGQQIGTLGQKGRATGPHLCWRMKWRGRNLDPSLFVGGEPGLTAG
jgi:murein DD-endopeptidase MepM/ murein hydrolase activator NlpD